MIRSVRSDASGFTILETIIVLVVTMALMAGAFTLFSEKVPRTQFASAVNEFDTKLRSVYNDVTTGYYPQTSTLTCKTTGFTGDVSQQGTNEDCVFLGKVIEFGPGAGCNMAAAVENRNGCNQMKVYTTFGNTKSAGKISTTLAEANPRLMGTGLGNSDPDTYKLGYGLYVTRVRLGTGLGGGVNYSVGYLQTFGTRLLGGGTGSEVAGTPQVQLLPMATGNWPAEADFITDAQARIGTASPNPENGVRICLASEAIKQYAVITIGEGGRTSASKIEIFEENRISSWNALCS